MNPMACDLPLVDKMPAPWRPRFETKKPTGGANFGSPSLVDRIVREMGPSLTDLARRIRRDSPTHEGAIVLLTGCRRGVGCTTVAQALARAAAAEQAILLIDGDLEEPGLSARLEDRPPVGWDSALRGLCPLEQVLVREADPPLTLLPLSQTAAALSGLLAYPALARWQASFRRDFDLVVLDGGAVWDGGAAWAPWVDMALVVCDSGDKLAEDWAKAWDRLEEAGTHVLGIIETLG